MLSKSNNKLLLQSINAGNSWRHYKKTKPVWAKKLDVDETVDTLEGPVTYRAGDYLCKGPSGDIWGQQKATLFKKYDPAPENKSDQEGWQKFLPKPDAAGVMAASVDRDFSVRHPVWGTFKGHAGDYLVKSYEDKDKPYPEDIWIVKNDIFESTYEKQ
jgi:hypothetical protein